MTETDFLQVVRERVGIYAMRFRSQNDFARHICVPQGSVSAYMKGQRGASVPIAIAENCPEVSLEWLFRGDGAMLLVKDPKPEPIKELPHPGTDPALIKVLLDRIEAQAVTIARLTGENTRYKSALGIV